jgi:hypothetical protein
MGDVRYIIMTDIEDERSGAIQAGTRFGNNS